MAKHYPFQLDPFQSTAVACLVSDIVLHHWHVCVISLQPLLPIPCVCVCVCVRACVPLVSTCLGMPMRDHCRSGGSLSWWLLIPQQERPQWLSEPQLKHV